VNDPNAYYRSGLAVATCDALHPASAAAADVAFYLECARRFAGPVLELATGTGRVLIALRRPDTRWCVSMHRRRC
jgi:hypothetical protein